MQPGSTGLCALHKCANARPPIVVSMVCAMQVSDAMQGASKAREAGDEGLPDFPVARRGDGDQWTGAGMRPGFRRGLEWRHGMSMSRGNADLRALSRFGPSRAKPRWMAVGASGRAAEGQRGRGAVDPPILCRRHAATGGWMTRRQHLPPHSCRAARMSRQRRRLAFPFAFP